MIMRNTFVYAVLFPLAAVVLLGLPGCPCQPKGHVSVLLSGGLDVGDKVESAKLGDISLDAIASLVVTLTEISLDRSDDSEPEGEEGEEGDGNNGASKVVLFSGAVDIDLRDLIGVSQLISTADVPAGTYTKIRLSIENPRMTLVLAPDVVITDIQTTANGRLFVSSTFEIPEGQDSLILLDLQGLHLVETGSGKFVWTPQLRAEISVEPANVQVQGQIDSVDEAADTLMLLPDTSAELVLVHYAGAVIFLATDTDTPTGTEAALAPGVQVIIQGELTVTGEVNAEVIWILPPA